MGFLGDPRADSGGEGKIRAISSPVFSLASTVCPWVSEDVARETERLISF